MSTFLLTAEHLHVLLNHLPIIGLAMGLLALALALLLRSRPAQIVALVLVLIAAASAWPVNLTGQRAYDTMHEQVDKPSLALLDTHMERAEKVAPAFYALALLAAAALAAPRKWPRSTFPLAIATLSLGALCMGASGWIGDAGGKIRHSEFRTEQPPASAPPASTKEAAHHSH